MAHSETPTTPAARTIHRRKLTQDFTVLPNALLRNNLLSFRARGVLAMMLSNADGWETNMGWLEAQGTEGRDAIRSAMKELEAAGYAVYATRRDGGKIVCHEWTWYDAPVPVARRSNRTHYAEQEILKFPDGPDHEAGSLPMDFPPHGNPTRGLPTAGKPGAKEELSDRRTKKPKKNGEGEPPPLIPDAEGKAPRALIREAWNRLVPSLPKLAGINGKRGRALEARWERLPDMQSWTALFERVEASDFMTGRAPGRDGRKWTADFDWILLPTNFDKVLEGKYDNKPTQTPTDANRRTIDDKSAAWAAERERQKQFDAPQGGQQGQAPEDSGDRDREIPF